MQNKKKNSSFTKWCAVAFYISTARDHYLSTNPTNSLAPGWVNCTHLTHSITLVLGVTNPFTDCTEQINYSSPITLPKKITATLKTFIAEFTLVETLVVIIEKDKLSILVCAIKNNLLKSMTL